jgi:hypothetical protein
MQVVIAFDDDVLAGENNLPCNDQGIAVQNNFFRQDQGVRNLDALKPVSTGPSPGEFRHQAGIR